MGRGGEEGEWDAARQRRQCVVLCVYDAEIAEITLTC